MPCDAPYSHFVKVDHYGHNRFMSELELNLKWWLDWSFLKIGGWENVETGSGAPYGGNFYQLKPIHDPAYSDGQIWETVRKEWCFETGVDYRSPIANLSGVISSGGGLATINTLSRHYLSEGDTIVIADNSIADYNDSFVVTSVNSTTQVVATGVPNSGTGTGGTFQGEFNPITPIIYVNTTGITTTTSGYEHYINYPLGRVVFDSPLNTGTDSVWATYSYRNVQTYIADSVPWFIEIQFDSTRPDHVNWDREFIDRGEWGVNAHHRIQLPAIVVEAVSSPAGKPYELGNLSLISRQDVIFHVIAQNRFERNRLLDIIKEQQHHTLMLFDSDAVAAANDFPLDYRGMVVSNAPMYPNIVSPTGYQWTQCWLESVNISQVTTHNSNLHIGRVRGRFQVVSR